MGRERMLMLPPTCGAPASGTAALLDREHAHAPCRGPALRWPSEHAHWEDVYCGAFELADGEGTRSLPGLARFTTQDNPVTAQCLGLVERGVGQLKEAFRQGCVIRMHCHAHAERQRGRQRIAGKLS